MQSLGYYLSESYIKEGIFTAKTVLKNTLSQKDFLKEMTIENKSFSENDYKDMMKTMVTVMVNQMAKGYSVNISKIMKISPSIRGSFNNISDNFNPGKHCVGINCTVSNSLISDFQKMVSPIKHDKPVNKPDIFTIEDTKRLENHVNLQYGCTIIGDNLLKQDVSLEGIEITDLNNHSNVEFISIDYLNIMKHTKKMIMFTFMRSYSPVNWLVNNTDISIKLRFKSKNNLTNDSHFFETVWVDEV